MIKRVKTAPFLMDQAYQAILDEICDGTLPAGTHLVQEQLARDLGVSRQPIQQVMALLKADGLVEEAPGRGLRVAELSIDLMWRHYEIRAVLDGLAARLAARRAAASARDAGRISKRGETIVEAGTGAVAAGDVTHMVRHDVEFHGLIYEASGNPFIASTAEPHWRHLRRVMGEILRRAGPPDSIWQQHREILDAVVEGDEVRAEEFAVRHIEQAAEGLAEAMAAGQAVEDQKTAHMPGSSGRADI